MRFLFEGLGDLGFESLDDMETFKVHEDSPEPEVKITTNQPPLTECVYEKNHNCPVCEEKFRSTSIKPSKVRFVSVDEDLMPTHAPLNPFYYNVVLCPRCGYAALADNFLKITDSQSHLIMNEISPKFKTKEYPFPLNEDMAIERYKFALLNAVVKRGRASEKAYLCLVISWLYKIKQDDANRHIFAKNSCEAFIDAYSKDSFPIYGMNESVTAYLVAELSRYTGNNAEAMKWLSRVLGSRMTTQKVKDMALDLKMKIQNQSKAVQSV